MHSESCLIDPIFTLLVACLALAIGPAVGASGQNGPRVAAANDGFTVVLVLALCAFLALPHALAELGLAGAGWLLLGAAIPDVLHRFKVRRQWSTGVILVLIALHAAVDGAIISFGDGHGSEALPWAVVAHRIPVGFALFAWAVRVAPTPPLAKRLAWLSLLFMLLVTSLGFVGGSALLAVLPGHAHAAIEAIVVGALISVVLRPRQAGREAATPPESQLSQWAGIGAMAGILVVLAAIASLDLGLSEALLAAAGTFWILVQETSPALVLGFALAGIVPYFLTASTLAALRRGSRLTQAARGVAYGLPLPVCSCGVLPVYQSLVRRGAPPVAALAFFVATPELGLDAVLLSFPLLGGPLTIARIVAAIAVALAVALLIDAAFSQHSQATSEPEPEATGNGLAQRLQQGIRFGFVDVFDHTMPWILLGLIIAALAEPLLAEGALHQVPAFLQVPLAAIVSVPLYVCASGATPVAALAIHKGLSAGAALAFLIAGPATNLTTFGILAKLHGRRMAFAFGGAVALMAILAGWCVDLIGIDAQTLSFEHEPAEHSSFLGVACATMLGGLLAASLLRQGPRGFLGQILSPVHAH